MAEGSTLFYVRVGGQTSGPFDTPGLRAMVDRGELSPTDDVSRDGGVTWIKAGRYRGLFPTGGVAKATDPAIYYYARDGRSQGPVSMSTLRQWAASGALLGDDIVWADGDAESSLANRRPELADAFPPSAYDLASLENVPDYSQTPAASLGYARPLSYQTPRFADVEYAGFWRRFAAYLIDWVCTVVISAIVGGLLGAIIGVAMAGGGSNGHDAAQLARGVGRLMSLLVGWLYYALFESSARRATPGKMALGIVVVDLSGRPIGFGQATGRYFGKIVSAITLCIGFMMAGWTERKQALHDQMAGTLVIVK